MSSSSRSRNIVQNSERKEPEVVVGIPLEQWPHTPTYLRNMTKEHFDNVYMKQSMYTYRRLPNGQQVMIPCKAQLTPEAAEILKKIQQ